MDRKLLHRGGGVECQNYGPFLGSLSTGGRIVLGMQSGTIVFTSCHIEFSQGFRILGFKVLRLDKNMQTLSN